MKTLFCAIGLLLVSCKPKPTEAAPVKYLEPPEYSVVPDGEKVGRFNLVAAQVTREGGDKESILFRIDTATGSVWRLEDRPYRLPKTQGMPEAQVPRELTFEPVPESWHWTTWDPEDILKKARETLGKNAK